MYLYGLFELHSKSLGDLENEIVQPAPGSFIQFAVIDATQIDDMHPGEIAAFRHDLDFYVFTSMSPARCSALRAALGPSPPVLCLATPLAG